MGIGMKELATLAGVSQTTVSLVLNGKADGRIARTKQERVRELARQYRYRPNLSAKGLREQKQYTIGVAMPMPVNPYYSDMVSRIQERLAQCGYMALFSFWKSGNEIEAALESVFLHNVDGIITWNYHDSLTREKIPTVIYDERHPGMNTVELDFQYSTEKIVAYLRELGHTRIGYIGNLCDKRATTLEALLRREKLPVNPDWFVSARRSTLGGNDQTIRAFLSRKERPSALVAQNDSLATACIFHAVRAGIAVPGDLSIVGFNNTCDSEYTLPPLTTVDAMVDQVVNALINTLITRIAHPDMPEEICTIRPELIIRESCASPKTGDIKE